MKPLYYLIVIMFPLVLSACDDGGGAAGTPPEEPLTDFFRPIPAEAVFPANNAYLDVKAELGELLFWDPILSGDQNVACASCHHPDLGWADGRTHSIGSDGVGLGTGRTGLQETDFNSPSILNVAFTGMGLASDAAFNAGPYFWDLRADSLEDQAVEPIKSATEMRGTNITEEDIFPVIVARLEAIPEYVEYFALAFAEEPAISETNIARAIATFQRTLTTQRTRFDEFIDGDTNALTAQEVTGLNKFVNGGCARCHSGPLLSDNTIHAVQPIITDKEAVRTPSLRNVALTPPFMHDGSRDTLRSAVALYEDRGDLEVTLADDDFGDIVAFLNTLTDTGFHRGVPASVPSGLPVGGDINQ